MLLGTPIRSATAKASECEREGAMTRSDAKNSRKKLGALVLLLAMVVGSAGARAGDQSGASSGPAVDARFSIGAVLYADDFSSLSNQWKSELEKGGRVSAKDGALDIDVPGGATVWFTPPLHGPVMIQYEATAVSAGGPHDRVSDLNCFWMASDSRNPADLFGVKRSGKFSDYNQLLCYYVGLGGNSNTTTRFRRYVGDAVQRPLLPGNDRREKADLLVANKPQLIQLVADGNLIQFYRDGRKIFEFDDPQPYTFGRFAFRTTASHLRIQHFRVFEIQPQVR